MADYTVEVTDAKTIYQTPNLINVIGTPSASAYLDICRRFSTATRATSDPVIATVAVGLDNTGVFQTNWTPGTEVKLSGSKYKYYPRVYDTVPSYSYSTDTSDIIILDNMQVLISYLEDALGDIQVIPVYDEVSKDTTTSGATLMNFTYRNWRDDYPILVFQDGDIITPSSYNYNDGSVRLSAANDGIKEISASYVFKFFEDFTMESFLNRAVADINMLSPVTHYTLSSFPDYWINVVMMQATLLALDAVFASVIFREKQLIFATKDIVTSLNAYYSRLQTTLAVDKTKVKKIHDTQPSAITGFDVLAPPRVTGHNFLNYVFLRGRAL